MDEVWQWIAAIGVPIFGGIIALWVRSHLRLQDKLDKNDSDHGKIRQEISDLDDKSAHRHGVVRDKIDQIWQHLVNKD